METICLQGLFLAGGERTFLEDATGALSFVKTTTVVQGLVKQLVHLGIPRGARFGVMANKDPLAVLLLLAAGELGWTPVLINPAFPRAQQDDLLASVGAICVLGPDRLTLDLPWGAGVAACVDELGCTGMSAALHARMCDDDFVILFTSGSSATPKGVIQTWGNHLWSARGAAAVIPLDETARCMVTLPLFHVGGVAIVVRALLAGAAVVFPGEDLRGSLADLAVTHASLVPTQLWRVADGVPPNSLRAVLVGGGPAQPALLDRATSAGWPLYVTYGATETTAQVATSRWPCASGMRVLPHREVSIDTTGAVRVRGPAVARGYATPSGHISCADCDGWLTLSDSGTLAEGLLQISGRIDRVFVSGGENVHPEAIERVLLSLPGVLNAYVVPVDDPEYGQRPVAFVKLEPGIELSHNSLRFVLPGYLLPVALLPWPEGVGFKPQHSEFIKIALRQTRGMGRANPSGKIP